MNEQDKIVRDVFTIIVEENPDLENFSMDNFHKHIDHNTEMNEKLNKYLINDLASYIDKDYMFYRSHLSQKIVRDFRDFLNNKPFYSRILLERDKCEDILKKIRSFEETNKSNLEDYMMINISNIKLLFKHYINEKESARLPGIFNNYTEENLRLLKKNKCQAFGIAALTSFAIPFVIELIKKFVLKVH